MRKNKILGLLGATGTLLASTIATGVVTSCSCSTVHIEVAENDVSIIGNNMAAYLHYTLTNRLGNNEKIVIEYDNPGQFTFAEPTVSNRLVKIPVYWLLTDVYDTVVWTGDIIFKCVNEKTNSLIWSQKISESKVTYYPYCILQDGMEFTATEKIDKTITAHLPFKIPTGLPTKYEPKLVAHIESDKYDDENEFVVNTAAVEITFDDATNIADVAIPAEAKATGVAEGASYKFDIQIYCMYGDTDIPIWISNKYTQVKVSYMNVEKAIPEAELEFEDDEYGLKKLVGISESAQGYNTLVIPNYVLTVGDGENAIKLPDTVNKISIAPDSKLTYFSKNSFAENNKVKFIDLSNIKDSVSGLETMQVGENSFAGWSDKGTIIWGSDLSQYKKHILILDLYQGGLSGSDWYNFVEITDGDENESRLREACASGSNVRLMNDITISSKKKEGKVSYTGQIEIQKSMLIDFNGHFITSENPIYDYEAKEFAIFGLWNGIDVVATDLSLINPAVTEKKMGGIKAYNQRKSKEKSLNLAQESYPDASSTNYDPSLWNRIGNGTEEDPYKFKPMECRCFYMRNDTPTKQGSSLEIMTGEYWGNCTTVLNWNGTCWIEDMYTAIEQTKYEFAPQFHVYTPYSDYNPKGTAGGAVMEPAKETINCDDGASATGAANFQVYSAKFYGVQCLDQNKEYINQWECYNPEQATADRDKDGNPHNWLAENYMSVVLGTAAECYRLTQPKP